MSFPSPVMLLSETFFPRSLQFQWIWRSFRSKSYPSARVSNNVDVRTMFKNCSEYVDRTMVVRSLYGSIRVSFLAARQWTVTRQYAWKVFDDSSQQPASCRANLSFAGRGVRRSTAGGFLGYSSIVKESEWLWAG